VLTIETSPSSQVPSASAPAVFTGSPPPRSVRTPILRGFAAALYRLGRRYEAGLGTSNNPNEAQRCYYKAAKLGNLAARQRLNDVDPQNRRDDELD